MEKLCFQPERFRGVIVALNACYDKAGEVSPAACRALCRWYQSLGVRGVYVGGSTGEGLLLSLEERKTLAEAAVQAAKAAKGQAHTGGCPGSRMRTMQEKPEAPAAAGDVPSQLRQWPVQIKLVSPAAPYFDGADLLIAADCTAYAYGNFHSEFMRGKVTLIGCPKLDAVQYAEKLTEIFARNDIRSVTLTRMEVPCCGGMEFAIRTALGQAGKEIPFRTVVLSIDGAILEER